MFSKELEVTISEAYQEARSHRHEFLTVEHLLLALLDNAAAVDVLKAVGGDVEQLRKDLTEYIESTTPLIPAGQTIEPSVSVPTESTVRPAATATARVRPACDSSAGDARPPRA